MVKVYSTPWCPYCEMAKKFLEKHSVQFEDIDVAQDEQKLQEMVKISGQMGVPVIDIDGKIMIGFNQGKLEELLDLSANQWQTKQFA